MEIKENSTPQNDCIFKFKKKYFFYAYVAFLTSARAVIASNKNLVNIRFY